MTGTLFARTDGTSCGASMVKMSVDFPSEAPRYQRFLSITPQITFDPDEMADAISGSFFDAAFCDKIIRAATGRPKCPTRNIQKGGGDPQRQMHQPASEWARPSPARSNHRLRASNGRPIGRRSTPSHAARCCPHQK